MTTASPAAASTPVDRRRSPRLIAVLVSLGLAVALLAAPTGARAATTAPLSYKTGCNWAGHMLATLNAERRAHHLPPLRMNPG